MKATLTFRFDPPGGSTMLPAMSARLSMGRADWLGRDC